VRKFLIASIALVLIALLAGTGLLWSTHRSVRAARTPLPNSLALSVALMGADRPVRLSYINTASQAMPRAGVLDPSLDPYPQQKYIMSHPSFVIEWADSRILLVDAGMTREAAERFGGMIEWLGDAGPIEPKAPVADALGAAASRVRAVIFTHLHVDHVDGLAALCAADAGPIDVFMTPSQMERPTYTTRDGLALVRKAPCAQIRVLEDKDGVFPVPGFPGVAVIAAAGHTPGSQLVVVQQQTSSGDHITMLAGDIANNIDGILHDIPKPWAYRTFVVPEDDERLSELRRYLREALTRPRPAMVLLAHDQLVLETSGVPIFHPQ